MCLCVGQTNEESQKPHKIYVNQELILDGLSRLHQRHNSFFIRKSTFSGYLEGLYERHEETDSYTSFSN